MLKIEPLQQKYIPQGFKITSWEDIEPFTKELLARPINSLAEYERFLEDESELDALTSEEYTRRMVLMTRYTNNKEYDDALNYYLQNISPKMAEYADQINRKIADSPFADQVKDVGFALALKGLRTQMELFRPENIPLQIMDEELGNKSGKVRGAQTVMLDGEEMTLQKAGDRLFWQDRAKREEAWKAIQGRQFQDKQQQDTIFAELVTIRQQTAKNAGFDNFRDYMFKSLRRFDYTPDHALEFHEAIAAHVVPLVRGMVEKKAKEMGLEKLRPWDGAVDPKGRPPLKAFHGVDDLIEKSTRAFANMDPVFHGTIATMHAEGHLDLESRPHKRPGGYMTGFDVKKLPFIFANATEKVRDLITLVHEVGHAVHQIQMRDLRLQAYGRYPMEVAELASMSMELLSMDQWHLFFDKEEDLKRAKKDHLETLIGLFPMIAQGDAFQHQIYLNPDMTPEERNDLWTKTESRFATGMVDWSGFEDWKRIGWHRVHHIFEVPFYYIEYGIAQLGALQVWRNYKRDPQKTLEQYKAALALGYTKSIPEIYETAGVKFDFSSAMLKDLMAFVQQELAELE